MTEKETAHGHAMQIQNTFLLFVHGTILLLSGMAVGSGVVAQITSSEDWDVPKTMELKLYAMIIIAAAIGTWIGRRFFADALSRPRPLYSLFWSIALPLVVVINTLGNIALYRACMILLLCGMGIVAVLLDERQRHLHHLQRISAKIFPWGMALSVALSALLSGQSTFTFFSLTTLIALCTIPLLLRLRSPLLPRYADIALVLCAVFFLFFGMFAPQVVDIIHYSFYLGPVVEMFYGHKHPLVEINAQYGGGSTWFLTAYFRLWGHVWNGGLNLLLKLLDVAQYVILYIVAVSLLRSRMLAFCTLIAMLIYNCFSQGASLFSYPSVGALRFGHIFLILLLYTVPLGKNGKTIRMHGSALVAAVATVWSFESFIYTVPAWMAAEMWTGRGKKAALHYAGYMCLLLCAYLLPPLLAGKQLDLSRYTEYATLYAGGFGQLYLYRFTDLWWLFPALYILILQEVAWGKIQDERITMLAIYGLAIFTYFVGRAFANNLCHISLPCILLGVYWLQHSHLPWKNYAIGGFLTIFLSVNFALFAKGPVASQILINNPIRLAGFSALFPDMEKMREEEKEGCAGLDAILRPYVYQNSLALIDPREGIYTLYDCLQVSNALNADPWIETAFNPKAFRRLLRSAAQMPNPTLLVTTSMLDNATVRYILTVSNAKKTGTLLGKNGITVFTRQK